MQTKKFACIILLTLVCKYGFINCKSFIGQDLLNSTILDLLTYETDHAIVTLGAEFRCVGVLINPLWVLTTTFCVNYSANSSRVTVNTSDIKIPGALILRTKTSVPKLLDAIIAENNGTKLEYLFEGRDIIPAEILVSYTRPRNGKSNLLLMKLSKPVRVTKFAFARIPHKLVLPGTKCVGFGLKNLTTDNYYVYNGNNGTNTIFDVALEVDKPRKCGNYLYKAIFESSDRDKIFAFMHGKIVAPSDQILPLGSPMVCDGLLQGISAKVYIVNIANTTSKIYNVFWPLALYKDWMEDTICKNSNCENNGLEFVLSSSENIHKIGKIFVLVANFYMLIVL